jgi:hypothetical protein
LNLRSARKQGPFCLGKNAVDGVLLRIT